MSNPLLPYTAEQIDEYQKELGIVGSLSNLFSDSSSPMIYYRATENIYCRAFSALNVSRSDCTADAIFNFKTGVGIKTFLDKENGSFQKIAEFNKQAPLYKNLSGIDLIKRIAELRNERIDFTVRNYGLKSMIYHCILRGENGQISVFEEPMNSIDIANIRIVATEPNKCEFTDGIEEYEFYFSKSTLFKHFSSNDPFLSFKVAILADPIAALSRLMDFAIENAEPAFNIQREILPSIIIPLYSENKKAGRFVAERSGLNEWNAGPRVRFDKKDHHAISSKKRNPDEIYIPYPKGLLKANEDFFPPRGTSWQMKLPNGDSLSMKVCQEGSKALMSNPNSALGEWLLREVLKLPQGHPVTYDELLSIGIDSIIIRKHEDGTFDCDFIDNTILDSDNE